MSISLLYKHFINHILNIIGNIKYIRQRLIMKLLWMFAMSVTLLFSMEGRIINGTQVEKSDTKYKAIAALFESNSFI